MPVNPLHHLLESFGKAQKKERLTKEVDRLLALYARETDGRQAFAGGAQNLLLKCSTNFSNSSVEQSSGQTSSASSSLSFCDLPVLVKFHIFSLLSSDDLCRICGVCREWNSLASDEYLWRRRLQKEAAKWRKIVFDKNPDAYHRVFPSMSSKSIYLRCRPSLHHIRSDGSSLRLTQLFHHLINSPSSHPRIVMFGPGLETKTSKIVRSILTDRCPSDEAKFKVIGMVPGEFAGVGSGIRIQFGNYNFNLITLYSNVKSVRQRLSAENRVRHNKLFTFEERQGDIVTEYYELTPAIQALCKHSCAFIYVVDASQAKKVVAASQAELFAMTSELWAPLEAPLLVLTSRRGICNGETLSSMDVVRALRLDRLNRKWLAQSCDVDTLDGIRSGMRWLLGEI